MGLLRDSVVTLRGASRIYAVDHMHYHLDKAVALEDIPIDFTSAKGSTSQKILRRQLQGVQCVVDCIEQNSLDNRLRYQQNCVINEAICAASSGGGLGIVGVCLPNNLFLVRQFS